MGLLLSLRHGQTNYNLEQRYTGQTDITLNETGMQEARDLAERLEKYPIDVIYCSPMIRTKQTIAPYLEKHPTKIIYRKELMEICMGCYQGHTFSEVKELFPEMYAANRALGSESHEQVWARLFPLLDEIKETHQDETVLVVTHGFIQRCIYKHFKNPDEETYQKFRALNCLITEYPF